MLLKLLVYLYMAQFKATLDFIHPSLGGKFFKDRVYELDAEFEGNQILLKVGYIVHQKVQVSNPTEVNDGISEMKFRTPKPTKIEIEKVVVEKEAKEEVQTKEAKFKKKTK